MTGIKISYELRPVLISGKEKGLFHKWVELSKIIPPSVLVGGHGGGVLKDVVALVEREDGRIGRYMPEEIRFVDNLIDEMCWGDTESTEGKQ